MHSLQCEQRLPNVRDQLRRLRQSEALDQWTKFVRELYSEEEDANVGESARIGTSTICLKALTLPPTLQAGGSRLVEVEIESLGWSTKSALATLQGPPGGPGPISHVLAGCFVCSCKVMTHNK